MPETNVSTLYVSYLLPLLLHVNYTSTKQTKQEKVTLKTRPYMMFGFRSI